MAGIQRSAGPLASYVQPLPCHHHAIIEWSRAMQDVMGNLEPTVDIYPNCLAPAVRNAQDGTRELTKLQREFQRRLTA